MNAKLYQWNLNINKVHGINLNLLIALCLVTQHSFIIKFGSIFILLLLNIPLIKEFQLKKIPGFYLLISILEVLKFVFLNDSLTFPHFSQFSVGITYWLSSLLVCWIIFSSIEKMGNYLETLRVVVLLNFWFTLFQFMRVCFIEHTLNPFNTGHNHPYGISSGDLLNGLFHGVHLTNAFISILLCLFFLYRNESRYFWFSLFPLLLTGSNYATLVFALGAAIYFVMGARPAQRVLILKSALITILFYVLITPLNAEYMIEKVAHVSATLPNSKHVLEREEQQRKEGYLEFVEADTINPYDVEGLTSKKYHIRGSASDSVFNFVAQSGKTRSYYQLMKFMKSSTPHFLFGAGMGGFSSKLAFNSSGVMEGSSLTKILPKYESPYFSKNHKALYSYLKTQHIMFHSESNRPFSTYSQLLGEYGIIGFSLFLFTYLFYFIKRMRFRSFSLPVLVALLILFNIDYLLESLSVILFFETLLFIDIKEKNNESPT